jgi:hypothetical protein
MTDWAPRVLTRVITIAGAVLSVITLVGRDLLNSSPNYVISVSVIFFEVIFIMNGFFMRDIPTYYSSGMIRSDFNTTYIVVCNFKVFLASTSIAYF